MNEKELLELKEEIEEAKSEQSQLKGRLDGLLEQLQKDWGCKTIAEAEKKLKKLDEEIEQLQDQITKQTTELEKELEEK